MNKLKQSYLLLLPARILKELIMLPVEILISLLVFRYIKLFFPGSLKTDRIKK